jgi:hypothetical protein
MENFNIRVLKEDLAGGRCGSVNYNLAKYMPIHL